MKLETSIDVNCEHLLKMYSIFLILLVLNLETSIDVNLEQLLNI